MTTETTPSKRRVPIWVKVLLGLSLALNLAVVGAALGVSKRLKNAPGGPGAVNYALPYVATLERDERRAVGQHVRQKAESGDLPSRRARREGYREMIALLRAETWDADAAQAVLARQSNETLAVQAAAQGAWLEVMASLSAQERLAYAARLEEFIEKRGRKPRKSER